LRAPFGLKEARNITENIDNNVTVCPLPCASVRQADTMTVVAAGKTLRQENTHNADGKRHGQEKKEEKWCAKKI
jgi:hypothetical protein